MNSVPNRGFSRTSNLLVSSKFTSDRSLLPWQRKFGNFNTELTRTQLIRLQVAAGRCTKQGVFKVKKYNGVSEIHTRWPLLPW